MPNFHARVIGSLRKRLKEDGQQKSVYGSVKKDEQQKSGYGSVKKDEQQKSGYGSVKKEEQPKSGSKGNKREEQEKSGYVPIPVNADDRPKSGYGTVARKTSSCTTTNTSDEPPRSLYGSVRVRGPITKTTHQDEEWYHGLLPREDTQRLLQDEGHYLVRVTEPSPGMGMMPILSVKWKGKPHHFILQEKNDKILLEKFEFNTIFDLVTTLAKEKRQLNDYGVMLVKPVLKQEWELKHTQIELGKLLGEGAFGGVYAGILTTMKEKLKVAVKENKGKEASKKQIEEICKEARIMRRYHHPNVVRFFGVAVEREPIMLVMEAVDGGALDSYLRKNKKDIVIKDQMSFSFSSAKGMDYLHSKGCIHRDVAARNCLVDTKTMTAKISDFGLSRELRDRAAKYKLKDLKQRLPIRWLAPEVLLAGTYSYKSDVYAFGVLLWEIFAYGDIPMKEMSLGEVNQAVKDGKRPTAPSSMPKFLRDVMVEGCYPAAPEARWPMAKIRSTIEDVVESCAKPKSCILKTSRQTL